jgi:hypothetical protein
MPAAAQYKLLPVLLFFGMCDLLFGNTYSTNFPASENPISEGGKWINGQSTGINWSNVSTTPGFARGQQQPDNGSYNDSTALLTGTWNPNQSVQVTVANSSPSDGSVREVEIRLRSTLIAGFCSGYEVYWSAQPSNPYLTIARWNGPLNSYANLKQTTSGITMHSGAVFSASISGTTITAYINGVQQLQLTDSTFSSGNPGMGFYLAGTGGSPVAQSQYGFSNFLATDDASTPNVPTSKSIPPAPTNLRVTGTPH